jgi:hypothetical protein
MVSKSKTDSTGRFYIAQSFFRRLLGNSFSKFAEIKNQETEGHQEKKSGGE